MSDNLGKKVTHGIAWSSIESFGGATITIATTMILARMIAPEDYGLIAVLQIFIAAGLLLVESGFSSALIRLSNRTIRHESTVLAFNITIALVIYLIIFFCAPIISLFYGNSRLIPISRLYALVIPLNSLCVVQHARLTATMCFGKILVATGIASLLSSGVAIILASRGAGVGALVWQQLLIWGLRAAILWLIQWKNLIFPILYISELKEMWGFGWKLLISSLISDISASLYSMVIGRVFSISQAGLFSKSRTLASFPAENSTSAFQRVSYPALCTISSDSQKINTSVKRFIGISSWLLFPIMAMLAALSPACITVVLGSRWLAAAPYFSLICIGYMLYPLHSINLNIINVFGRSDLFLRLEIIKVFLSILLILGGTFIFGMIGICMALVIESFLCIFINGYYTKKFSGVSLYSQIKIIASLGIMALAASGVAYLTGYCMPSPLLSFIAGILSGGIIYLGLSYVFVPKYLTEIKTALSYLKH